MEVRYVDWTLANRFENHIELNKNLRKYPDLHDAILKHEMDHTDKPWTFHDLKMDMQKTDKVKSGRLIRFMFTHPKSFLQFAPFYWRRNGSFVFDLNMTLIYGFLFAVVGGAILLGNVFN